MNPSDLLKAVQSSGVGQTVGNMFNGLGTAIHNVEQAAPQAFQTASNQVLSQPLTSFQPVIGPLISNLIPRQYNPTPSISDYLAGNIGKPLVEGSEQFQQPGLLNKVKGAAQMGQGLFSASPVGMEYNAITGVAGGLLRSVRTGENPIQSVRQGLSESTDIGGSGLGIQNPFLATGVDLVTGNPKSALERSGSLLDRLQAMVSGPKPLLSDDDAKVVPQLLNKIRTGNFSIDDQGVADDVIKRNSTIPQSVLKRIPPESRTEFQLNELAGQLTPNQDYMYRQLPGMNAFAGKSQISSDLGEPLPPNRPIDRTQLTGKQLSTSTADLLQAQQQTQEDPFITGLKTDQASGGVPPIKNPEAVNEMELNNLKEGPGGVSSEGGEASTIKDALYKDFETQQNVEQRSRLAQTAMQKGVDQSVLPKEGESATNYGENKLFRQAVEHPENLDGLAKQANNPEAFKTAVYKFQDFTDYAFSQLKDAGSRIGYLTDYYSHILDLSDPKVAEKFEAYINQKAMNYKGWFSKDRVFSNIEELEKAGFQLKNPSVVQDLYEYTRGAQKNLRAAILTRELEKASPGSVYTTKSGEAPPLGYRQLRIPGMSGTYVKPEVYQGIRHLEPLEVHKVIQTVDNINTKLKGLKLFGGGFHALNTGLDFVAQQLNSLHVPRIDEAARAFLSPNYWNSKLQDYVDRGVVDYASKTGVTLGRMDDIGGTNTFASNAKGVINASHRAIFDRMINYFKLAMVDDIKSSHDISTPQGLEEARKIGAQINNIYGGQNLEVMQRSKGVQMALRLLTLAPDYQEGRLRRTLTSLNPTDFSSSANMARTQLATRILATALMAEIGKRLVGGNQQNQSLLSGLLNPTIPLPYSSPTGHQLTADLPSSPVADLFRIGQEMAQNVKTGQSPWPAQFATSHLAAVPSLVNQLITGKDYYGNNLSVPNLLSGQLPIPAVQYIRGAQGKENPITAVINTSGLKVHTSPSDPAVQYMNSLSEAEKSIQNPNDRGIFTSVLHPTKKDADGNVLVDKTVDYKPEQYQAMMDHPAVLTAEQNFQKTLAQHAPIWDLPQDQLKAYIAYTLTADTGQKAQLRILNPWIPQMQLQQAQYGQQIAKQLGTPHNAVLANPMQQLTPDQVKVVSAYTAAPARSAQRKQILAQNPWLQNYWNQNSAFYQNNPQASTAPPTPLNQYLESVGIQPATGTASSSGSSSSSSSMTSYVRRALLRDMDEQMSQAKEAGDKITEMLKSHPQAPSFGRPGQQSKGSKFRPQTEAPTISHPSIQNLLGGGGGISPVHLKPHTAYLQAAKRGKKRR